MLVGFHECLQLAQLLMDQRFIDATASLMKAELDRALGARADSAGGGRLGGEIGLLRTLRNGWGSSLN